MSLQSLNFKALTGLLILLFLFVTGCKNSPTGPSGTSGESQYKIAFSSYRQRPSGNFEIYVVNADSTNLTRLTSDTTISNLYPEWSPDGTKIVYVHGYFMNDMGIYVMNSDGTNQQRLTTGLVLWPTWSPVRLP